MRGVYLFHICVLFIIYSPCEGIVRLVALFSGLDHALGQPFMRVAVVSFRESFLLYFLIKMVEIWEQSRGPVLLTE
jgi:hypothetical protein